MKPQGVRILLGVRGLADDERPRVHAALEAIPGVLQVEASDAGQVAVEYDDTRTTVMTMIRALRQLGYLAGME